MAKDDNSLDTPRAVRRRMPRVGMSAETFGQLAEGFARFMGTPAFLVGMTVFCAVWLGWNTWAPESAQFDPRALNYTLLTLILSLQASYAAPLILLAENRSADRDRVEAENDRILAERNLSDTEFLMREVASLRIALREVATRDYLRSEMRTLLEEIEESRSDELARAFEAGRRQAIEELRADSDAEAGSPHAAASPLEARGSDAEAAAAEPARPARDGLGDLLADAPGAAHDPVDEDPAGRTSQ